ncbi:hypothetical protein [Viridibacterium curvum]|uniref:Uncharacterized protein n=1 Tax=Viridibacterium curvum TaxID=1101404 RepID=A0ABP9QF67_9RHOO
MTLWHHLVQSSRLAIETDFPYSVQHLLQPAAATGSPWAQVSAPAGHLAAPQGAAICREEQKLYRRSNGRNAEGFSFVAQRMQDGVIGVENENSHRAGSFA